METEKNCCKLITLVLLGFLLVMIIGYPYVNVSYENFPKNRAYRRSFLKFLKLFNKSYVNDVVEYRKRFENFKISMRFIEKENIAKTYGENVEFGYTKFSDLTDDEFIEKYLNDNKTISTKYRTQSPPTTQYSIAEFYKKLPLKIDWRERGIITGVRDQGHCGSCYAHSVISTIESSIILKYKLSQPVELSIQQMIDCAGNSNHGCIGGDTCGLLEWLKLEKIKILPKKLYPDNVNNDETQDCKNITLSNNLIETAKVLRYTCLDFTGFEYEIINILANNGPLVASVNGLLWKNYIGGVMKYHCNGPSNHAVQIIGYDLSPPEPHYIIRNSWGIDFGNNGFAKISFGNNVCNIATEVSMVQVEWG